MTATLHRWTDESGQEWECDAYDHGPLCRRCVEVEPPLPAWCVGAVGMARYWLRNPERMTDAGFPQVCRELYTISRALSHLAARDDT